MAYQPPQRFGALDAVFLNFESKEMPLHIGGVCVFDGKIPFDRFVASIESKLDQIPRYRQKVMRPFLDIGYPTWQWDTEFDIGRHMFHVTLDAPGSEEQLRQLANRLFTPMMDRSKPLWELYVVDGLEGGRSAIIAKIHHCIVDGVAGIGLLNIMLDPSPDEPRRLPKPKPFNPPPPPDAPTLFMDALADSLKQFPKRVTDVRDGVLGYAGMVAGDNVALLGVERIMDMLPELLSPLEKLPFNRPCSGERRVFWNRFSFQEARAIRTAAGGSVNDVVLTVLAGAVSRYTKMHRQTVKNRFFRAMVPVNLRPPDGGTGVGNLISMLPVTLPLGIADPIRRLRHINEQTLAMKASRMAELVRVSIAWLGVLPPAVQSFLAANTQWLNTLIPIFHMVCTNVPGPQIPLYTCGKRMLTMYPHVPTGMDVGISMAVNSYDQKLFFALTSDAKAAPDAGRMQEFLNAAWVELREAAGVPEMEPHVTHTRVPRRERAKAKTAKAAAKESPKAAPKAEPKSKAQRRAPAEVPVEAAGEAPVEPAAHAPVEPAAHAPHRPVEQTVTEPALADSGGEEEALEDATLMPEEVMEAAG